MQRLVESDLCVVRINPGQAVRRTYGDNVNARAVGRCTILQLAHRAC